MNLPSLIRRNMPNKAHTTGDYINLAQSLNESLGFGDSTGEDLTMKTMLLASMTNSYVEGSSHLTGISGQTVRNHLRDKDPERLLQINSGLIATMRGKGLFKNPVKVAIDWHDEMFYGDHETDGVIGTKNKAGTNYAYEYATASVVVENMRFAIAVIPVGKRTILAMVIMLLQIIQSHGIRISVLLMDGGFFSIDLINYLNSTGTNFIMHAPKMAKECNGKEMDMKYTTSSHNRRKRDQASFRLVSIYAYGRM